MLTAILLASGFSCRLQTDKLMLDFHGRPVIEHIMAAINRCPFDQKLLVQRSDCYTSLGAQYGFCSLTNDFAADGQSASVRIGTEHSRSNSAYMFFVGDQPCMTADIILQLQHIHGNHPDRIIVPAIDGRYRNPVIFPARFRSHLLAVKGDQGGRTIIKSHPDQVRTVAFEDPVAFQDIDTIRDYQFLMDAFRNR